MSIEIFKDTILKPVVLVSVLLALALCGCTSTGERSQLKEEVKEAAGITETDWVERRRETLTQAKEKLDDIRKDSERIKRAGEKMAGSKKLKIQFKEKWEATQNSLTAAEKSFADLEQTKASDWESRHQTFLSTMNVLEDNFHQLRSMVK